jgi:hypothetical protein
VDGRALHEEAPFTNVALPNARRPIDGQQDKRDDCRSAVPQVRKDRIRLAGTAGVGNTGNITGERRRMIGMDD